MGPDLTILYEGETSVGLVFFFILHLSSIFVFGSNKNKWTVDLIIMVSLDLNVYFYNYKDVSVILNIT